MQEETIVTDDLDNILNETDKDFFELNLSDLTQLPHIDTAAPQNPSSRENCSLSLNIEITTKSLLIALATENFQLADKFLKENKASKTNLVKEIQKRQRTEKTLFRFIKAGNLEACKYLIENGLIDKHDLPRLAQKVELGNSIDPFLYAIDKNQFHIANYFVKENMVSGIEFFDKEQPTTFLFYLITTNNLKGCKYLFKKGLVKNNSVSTEKRFNALLFAVGINKLDIADYLIGIPEAVDYAKKWNFCEEDKKLGSAYYYDSFPFYLIEKMGNVALKAFFYLFDKQIFSINQTDSRGFSLFMKALIFNRMNIAAELIKRGCDLDYVKTWRTSIGMPFLSFLITTTTEKKEPCELLLQHNLFEHTNYEKKEFDPLFLAIKEGLFEIADLLIDKNISKKWIGLTHYINEGNLVACKYLVEKQLVHIEEKAIELAKKNNHLEILNFLLQSKQNQLKQMEEQRKKQFGKIQEFFQKLMEDSPALVSGTSVIIASDQLVVDLNLSHPDYKTLVKQIQKHQNYFAFNKETTLKSVTLPILKIKESDFRMIQSIFQLEQPVEKSTPSSIIAPITEPFYPPITSQTQVKRIHKNLPQTKTAFHQTRPQPEKPKNPQKKEKTHKKPSHQKVKGKKPVAQIHSTHLQEKKKITTLPSPQPKLPKALKVSLYELSVVKRHGQKTEYTIAPPTSDSLPLKETLCFHYYEAGLPGQKKTIKSLTLPDEKRIYLDELISLCAKIQNEIKNANHTHIGKQAFLYDCFFLLELIKKTFGSVENINDIIPLSDIKALRESMKLLVFNQRKQNASLANLIAEAEKICQQLQHLNDALRIHQLNKIERLNIITESLQTRDNQIVHQYNSSFFKNVSSQFISELQFLNLFAYVQEFLQYMEIIEDDSKPIEEKSMALSAAKWCIIGLDKQQKLFEKNIGKSDILKNAFLLIHEARNQLAHSEVEKNSDIMKNPIMNEKIVLNLKDTMLTLQKLTDATSALNNPGSFIM